MYAVKTSEKANMCTSVIALAYFDLIRSLCVPWRPRNTVPTKGVYQLPLAIYMHVLYVLV